MTELNDLEKKILDLIQQDIPLEEYPFREMAEKAGTDEGFFVHTLQSLLERDLIRDISAIYNAKGLGYKSTLVALASGDPEKTAEAINGHSGVSHNYYREHEFNVWFTMTIPEDRDLDDEIQQMLEGEDYIKYRILPSLQTFKIGVNFNYSGDLRKKSENNYSSSVDSIAIDRDLIRELQKPFPLVSRPWEHIADLLGRDVEDMIAEIEALKKARIIKRISAVVRHRKTGYGANGMACFKLPSLQIEEAGIKAARYSAVSHCYERPVYPDWPYSLFAMTHGSSEEECQEIIGEIASEIGAEKTLVLYSTKEYKKERVKYFMED